MSRDKRGSAKRKTSLLIFLFVIVLGVAAFCAYTLELKPHKLYLKAEEELANGNLAEASGIYKSIGSYKDSREKYGYTACVSKFDNGSAAEAAEIFGSLSEASKDLVRSRMGSFEALGISALASSDYDTARAYLSISDLSDESQAALTALDIRAEALALIENEKYAEAREVLSVLDDKYINASEVRNECYRNEFAIYDEISKTDITAAVEGFRSIIDYAPAASYIRDLEQAYKQALTYMSEGNYDSAAQLFGQFGNYADSELMLTKCNRIISGEAETVYAVGEIVVLGTRNAEPVKWVVADVSDNSATLISQSPVAVMSYDSEGNSIWSASGLCAWLKNDFITAFSSVEKGQISMITRIYPEGDVDTALVYAVSSDEIPLIDTTAYTGYSVIWISSPGSETGTALCFDIDNPEQTYDSTVTEEHDVMAVIKLKF